MKKKKIRRKYSTLAKKKKVAKKKTRKKAKRKGAKRVVKKADPQGNLHTKKLQIMKAIPMMPCSAVSKDRQGLAFAHTRATEVYNRYREECSKRKLVIRRIEGMLSNQQYVMDIHTGEGWDTKEVVCACFEGVWEITDIESGEKETFGGSGYGDNDIWSANSAQTVAKKQALLDYFEVAWPQPTNLKKIIKQELADLSQEDLRQALQEIIPIPGVVDVINKFFEEQFKKVKVKK